MDATGAVEQDRRGQANVHYEILQQENASSNSRSQRILGELAVLCSDRDTVLSTDSLQYLSTAGRAEGVKLSAEKVLVATSGKKDDYSCSNSSRMSSEASRRQRVEELTRFFMEAKSDIEFALSGGGRRNESMRATSAVAAAAAELDLNDDDRDMIDSSDSTSSSLVIPPLPSSMTDQMSGDADTSSSSTPLLPPPPPSETDIHVPSPAVPLHIQLLEDAVDPRVFHPLLLAIRETDPLLYGTIVCHPLVTGHDAMPKKFESGSKRASKKKKQRGTAASTASSSKSKKPEMYHPDFTLPPLTPDETALNLARFVARAIGDRSVQALLLVVKVMASYPLHEVEIPVGSHLQILSGQAPSPSPPASVEKDKERASPNAESAASLDFISSVMELEGQLDPLAALRSRLGRFEQSHRAMDNDAEEDEDRLVEQMSLHMPNLDEGVDEEALMARAIALSLSPEVGLKDEKTDVPPPPLPLTPTIIEQPTPVPFSPDELWRLYDPLPDVVDGATVIMYCLGALLEDCQSYVASVKRSILPAASPVVPHPLTFLLLHSNLAFFWNVLHDRETVATDTSQLHPLDEVVVEAGQVVVLHVLELHLFHVDVVGTAPASVGLGQSVANPNPVPTALKVIVERYTAQTKDMTTTGELRHPVAVQYHDRVLEQALVTWVHGLAYFYPDHSSRHRLLVSLLDDIHSKPLSDSCRVFLQYQLDLMCTRMALPDLALPFVPLQTVSCHQVDDAALVQSSSTKSPLVWAPSTIREGLNQGTCSVQAVMDMCNAAGDLHQPKLSSSEVTIENVAELYQQLFDKVQAEIHTIWNELPVLADLLLRHVHIYPTAQSPPPSAFPHAPLVANVTASSSPVLLLLRALQDGMLQCIHGIATGSNGQPSPAALEFDPSRCAETLTLVDNNTSAKQHTAKQWGMVLSTYACAPNTGLHEWAVRLDRCEKGHVFLGVCTRDAAVSTYVGGDRQGWGLIGTRALWHNRSKVRGDYGDGFSTGSTVRVRLNTDTGALSFGLLDDDSDWGTAFDGLTQYGALYPAIGLYQRDDQVTLVHTHNFSGSMPIPKALSPTHLSPRGAVHGSESPFPTQSFAMDTDVVFQTLVSYTHKVLDVEQLSVPLLSALALMKASWRVQFAWHLLPAMVELVKRLDSEQHPWQLEIGGTWELKSSAAGNIPAQQYVVELTQDSRGGDLTGHSVSTNAVSLKGSTCLVAGRVRVDGKTFAGTYEDTKSHTSGRIMGECKASASTAPSLATSAARPVLHLVASTLVGAYISSFLTHDAPVIEKSMIGLDESEIAPSVADAPFEEYDEWINCSLLSGGLPLADISRHLQALVQTSHHPLLPWFQPILPPPLPATSNEGFSSFLQDLMSGRESGVDSYVTKHAGESAFVRLGGEAMKTAKRTVLAAMLWHAQVASIDASQEDIRPSENILHIWRSAHRVIEWGIRTKNANAMTYASVATLITRRARFLLRLQPIRGHHVLQERAFSEIVMNVSRFIEAGVQLKRLESMMLQNCSRAYFRMLGLNAMRAVVELGLQQSAGLCGVLQWLSNVDSLDQSVSIHGGSHYLDALGGAGTALHRQVRESWEQLYGNLAALLSRATWAKDHDVQLVVLQAWGVIITPDDHAFISRVGIFRTLQTVLDEARSSAASSSDNHSPTKPIVQAALKVVHLLAAQVATSSHEEPAPSSTQDVNASIPLVRQPSGPETLGKSVFNMLYTELNNACQEDVGPQQYCYQICSLLHSVSGAAICRQHLSSGRWLRLLLQLVERGTFAIQQRVLQLLRRLLPFLSPLSLHIQATSDDEYMGTGDDDDARNASELVGFFLNLLGRLIPTVSNAEGDKQTGKQSNLKLHHGCGVEVVLLLRSLLPSPEWATVMHAVFLQALSAPSNSFDFRTRALAVLCVLGGHIEGLQVGMVIQLLPRSTNAPTHEIMFRGAKGVLVGLDVEKGAAEVLLHKNGASGATTDLSLSSSRSIRVPLEDISALPDVECKSSDISQPILAQLVQNNLPYFLTSVLNSNDDPSDHDDDAGDTNESQDAKDQLVALIISLMGFRALGSLVQQGDVLVWLRASIPALFQVATIHTQNTSDIGLLEEHWIQMYKKWCDTQRPPSVDASNGDAAHDMSAAFAPPSALCQQMMEMGFPREWCEVALQKCSYQVEAAINFCFEHSSDMDRLVKQPNVGAATRRRTGGSASAPSVLAARSNRPDVSPILLEQLSEMGFPITWCKKALIANRNNVDAALTWILSNGEALEADDRRQEEQRDAGKSGDLECPAIVRIPQGPNPLRPVSGLATINDDMLVEGSAGGGFASVGAPDCIALAGKWYYEATLSTSGCIQIGWADAAFSGASERGDGVGDGPHSWAYDGWRQMKWHGNSCPYGLKWKPGDVIGCGIDCDAGMMFFTLNGKNMDAAFRGVEFAGGVYPCASFNRRERLTFNLGGLPFKHPIPGFSPVLHTIWTPTCNSTSSYDKGEHEDCLEEYVGEEYFDCRYFAKDIKASGGARIKSTVDPTMDFRALTRALAILHCRKMLVYILAASPTSLLDDVPTELVTTFLKLVATYTSPASTVSEIFKPAVVTALSPHLEDAILRCIDDQIRLASGRKYAKIHWDSAVESIVTNQLSMLNVDDPPVVWHDSHVLAHPNVGLAEFVTTLMASKHPVALIQAWSRAFRSPSMNLKEKAFRILSGLVPQVPISQLEAIPVARLHALTCARLAKEYVNYPVVSKYLESLMELTATLFVVSPSEAKPSLEPRITKAIQLLQMLDQLPVVQTPSLAPPDTESPPSETRLLSNAPDDDDMSSEDQNASLLTPTTPPSPSAAPSFQTSPTVGPPVTVAYLTPAQKSILLAAQYGFKVGDTEWHHGFEMGVLSDEASQFWSGQLNQPFPVQPPASTPDVPTTPPPPPLTIGCKVIRGPNWKWRDQDGGQGSIGVVEGISPWSGIEGEGMSVRWPNDALYTYRWGADGQYDLTHVEVDSENQVITTYPTPEIAPPSKQQVQLGVIFRLHRTDLPSGIAGVVEYPDMNAVIAVVGQYAEHSMELVELGMVQGDVDMGWQVKFGCDRWVPGTQYHLTEDGTNLTGEYTHSLWQPETKTWVPVQSTLEAQSKHLFVLDKQATFSTMNLSDDRMSVQCTSGEARNLSLGTVGFSSGIHYWEVRVDHGEFGSVFLGVCEKHVKGQPSLNLGRWQGWGFVNFRATYHNSTERIYGDHFNTGDTIGVCLNMESGKLRFFMDGIKYGEHIVTDLGVAFDGLKSDRHIKTLYPCIGLRKAGDKVTLNGKWVSQPGLSPTLLCQDNVELQSVLHAWSHDRPLPLAFMQSSYAFYTRWRTNRYRRVAIRSKGMQIDVDTSVERCIQVCGSSPTVLVAGDRVRIISKGGRALDAPEEAIVLGVYRNRLWYRVETQGNEGGEEGRGYAWYWDNEELPELVLIKRNGIEIQATTTIPPPDAFASATNQAPLVGFDAFCTLAHGMFATDQSIVDQINSLCATVGVDVINLPCQAVDIAVQPRVALLMVLNQKVLRSLPLVRFDDRSVRALRRLTFTSTKLSFWDATLKATATPTPLPSDEYEDPREIRIIRINRIQAQASKLALCPSPSDRLRKSVFGQLYREMRTWSDSGFRRAYTGKGHGGQKRAFKVKFLGEGVNDYGGPYRAVFEQIVDELQMDQVEITKGEQGLLPLLVPCPNRRSGTGMNQDKFVLNPSCGTISVAVGPIALELHRFLGKLIGTAVRHGLQMGLDLPSVVWRPLVGLPLNRHHLEDIDVVAFNTLTTLETLPPSKDADEYCKQFTFTTHLSDGTEVALRPDGETQHVDYASRDAFVDLTFKKRLVESGPQLAALREGLSAVIPMEIAGLFTAKELETLVCGRREVDVSLLKQCTEYEDVDPNSDLIVAFWQVLEEFSPDERTLFLLFVWARSRMPNSAKDFPMNFKIQAPHDQGARSHPDQYLPHAQTCFFSLSLPAYSTKEILKAKLLYAIQNSPNMDADVRLHNAEGWADA
ncbi:hypothetical protein, variant [Aphanomyces invadans]|uniref:B30.2/SPRY domain-containing protein n=1 Tax=Aphanomyces invadans TaxID=157072 RepID=A0A024TU90_9STRA|nr:hypothetical protein, variant [Aphanomyces invadans]ETV97588.1 hypothetical protein, variant [Aphanomyces invadans]|eukprot:XP_008873797.1 hypothetical protein, variant [Aphanomyces invadans]